MNPTTGLTRGKGTYTPQACNRCRRKKTKCDGVRPCSSCNLKRSNSPCLYDKPTRGKRGMADLQRRLALLERTILHISQPPDPASANFEGMGIEGESSDDESSDSDVARQISRPMANLALDGESLVQRNNLTPFRFERLSVAPRIPQPDPRKRYCLQLGQEDMQVNEGRVLGSSYNPDFEFDRYLPKDLPGGIVLTREEHDKCLSLFFKFIAPWGERINEHMFLRDMWEAIDPERPRPGPDAPPPILPHWSPMTHNAMVAVALSFSDNPKLKDKATRDCYANKAESYIHVECRKPALRAIRGLSLIGTYHSANGDTSLGFLYSGMSTRMNQALGLHVDCSSWVTSGEITKEYREERIRIWWMSFCLEVCWSAYRGGEVSIPSLPPHLQVPYPSVETELHTGIPFQDSNISLTFASTCSLMMITRKIMDKVAELQAWEDGLDPALASTQLQEHAMFTPHTLMLHMTRWWSSILLHRPFFDRHCKRKHPTHSQQVCRIAAEKIMQYTAMYQHLFSLRYVPINFCQMVFAAATVYLMLAGQAATKGEKESTKELLEQANRVVEYLRETGHSFECANKVAKILHWDLIEEQVKPWIRTNLGETFMPASLRDDPPLHAGDAYAESGFGGWGLQHCSNEFSPAIQPASTSQVAHMIAPQQASPQYYTYAPPGSSTAPATYNYNGMNEEAMPLWVPAAETMGNGGIMGLPAQNMECLPFWTDYYN